MITAKPKQVFTTTTKLSPTNIGTVAITSIGCPEHFLGATNDDVKTVAFYLNKVRDGMMIMGAKTSEMEEVEKALVALKSHLVVLENKLKVTTMEERMLALEKAVKMNLEEPTHKAAPVTVPGSGGRHTNALIVASLATKKSIRNREANLVR